MSRANYAHVIWDYILESLYVSTSLYFLIYLQNWSLYIYCLIVRTSIQYKYFKKQLKCMVVLEVRVVLWRTLFWHLGTLLKNQIFNCACGFIIKFPVIQYHHLLSTKVISINRKSRFDQLATASSSTHP